MIYKSHCSCTGNERISVFVKREICKSEKVQQNEMESSCCSAKTTTECSTHSTNCNCDSPDATYFKLKNKVVNEEVKFVKLQTIQVFAVLSTIHFGLLGDVYLYSTETEYIDPPPGFSSTLDFLIHIQQLKIPHLA